MQIKQGIREQSFFFGGYSKNARRDSERSLACGSVGESRVYTGGSFNDAPQSPGGRVARRRFCPCPRSSLVRLLIIISRLIWKPRKPK